MADRVTVLCRRVPLFIILGSILALTNLSCNERRNNLISVQGKPRFLLGVNLAWNSFGTDVGKHPTLGILHDALFFDSVFAEISGAGGNSVRWWVHCDGRSNPTFDSKGKVIGLDAEVFDHLDTILNLAKRHRILVMPVLWSFDMANDRRKQAGPNAGMHAKLITDSAYTKSYIENCLIGLARRYRNHPALLGWEICNEPEWMLNSHSCTVQRVSTRQLQAWVGRLASAIRRESPHALITVGSASLKWNWDNPLGKERNLWSDAALCAATGDPLAFLSFYQIHYYPAPGEKKQRYSPFEFGASRWNLDKPILIGEFPGKGESGRRTAEEMYRWAVDSSYAGALAWSYIGKDAMGSWSDIKPGIESARHLTRENRSAAQLRKKSKKL